MAHRVVPQPHPRSLYENSPRDRLSPPANDAQRLARQGAAAGLISMLLVAGFGLSRLWDRDSSAVQVTAAGAILPTPEITGADEALRIVEGIKNGTQRVRVAGTVIPKGEVNLRSTPRFVEADPAMNRADNVVDTINGDPPRGFWAPTICSS